MSDMLDLGGGVELRYFARTGGDKIGATIKWADCGHGCVGSVYFDTPESHAFRAAGPKWQVQSWDPLTITPSVRCSRHDGHEHHGFITDGVWRDC